MTRMVEPVVVAPLLPRSEAMQDLVAHAIETGDPARFNECASGYMLVRKHGSRPPFHFKMIRVDQIVDVEQHAGYVGVWMKGNDVHLTEVRVLDSMTTMCCQVVAANEQLHQFAVMIAAMQGDRLLQLVKEACHGIAIHELVDVMLPVLRGMVSTEVAGEIPGALARELEAASVRLEQDRLADDADPSDAPGLADGGVGPPESLTAEEPPTDSVAAELQTEAAVNEASKPPGKRNRSARRR